MSYFCVSWPLKGSSISTESTFSRFASLFCFPIQELKAKNRPSFSKKPFRILKRRILTAFVSKYIVVIAVKGVVQCLVQIILYISVCQEKSSFQTLIQAACNQSHTTNSGTKWAQNFSLNSTAFRRPNHLCDISIAFHAGRASLVS